MGLLHELTDAGHYVEIRAVRSDYPPPGKVPQLCSIQITPKLEEFRFVRFVLNCIRKTRLVMLIPVLEVFWFVLHSNLARHPVIFQRRNAVRVNIGIDCGGGVAAWISSLFSRCKYVYLSLELNDPEKFYNISKVLYWLESVAIARAQAVVIQDEPRLESLRGFHKKIPKQVYFLPNSPSGSSMAKRDPNYFHRLLEIDPNAYPHLMLQAGMVQDAVYCQELAAAQAKLDNGFAMIFHSSVPRSEHDPYNSILKGHNSKNLFLSLKPVPFDEVETLFASVTIGLAFYRPLNANFSNIAQASGKLPIYLKYGIPVLMNTLPSFQELLQKYEFGITIDDPSNSDELSRAITKIMANYSYYRQNAIRCFAEQFNFNLKCEPVRHYLESI